MAVDFSKLAVGVDVMDAEHWQLAGMFDEFEHCFHRHGAPETVELLVQEALSLANTHFEHEEALMEATDYPEIAEHKFHHRNLRLQYTTLVGDTVAHFRSHDPVTLEHLSHMRHLLSNHIAGPDMALANYLKTAGVK